MFYNKYKSRIKYLTMGIILSFSLIGFTGCKKEDEDKKPIEYYVPENSKTDLEEEEIDAENNVKFDVLFEDVVGDKPEAPEDNTVPEE